MARHLTAVPPTTLAGDHITVKAVQGLSDYQPLNPICTVAQLLQFQASLTQVEQAEKAAEVALEQARAARVEATHVYHNAVVAARAHVVAQYGPDDPAVALIGLKRKSERKQPARQTTTLKQ